MAEDKITKRQLEDISTHLIDSTGKFQVLMGMAPKPDEKSLDVLLQREERLIAEVLASFRNLVMFATESVGNDASPAQAAYNAAAMDIETDGMIKSVEGLLQLTRTIRELLIIGPIRKPGEGEEEAEAKIGKEVQDVVDLLNKKREEARKELIDQGTGQAALGQGSYVATGSEAKGDASGAPAQGASR